MTKRVMGGRQIGFRIGTCVIICGAVAAANPGAAEDSAKPSTGGLVEVITKPGPPGWVTKRFFANSPNCVSAKLDVWFGAGRYTHQLFSMGTSVQHDQGPRPLPGEKAPSFRQVSEGDETNPATQQIMDSDSTTILIGRAGCRIRVRIERAE